MFAERVIRYLAGAHSEDFDTLALAVFAYQYERIPAYRSLCDRRGLPPEQVRRWQDVPLVPTLAFRTLKLATEPEQEVFHTSGTTGPDRGTHYHPFPALYRAAIDASFPRFCLPGGERAPVLSLIPPPEVLLHSSLSFMAAHLVERYGGAGSVYAFGEAGLEATAARSWLAARQRDGRPALLLTTGFALSDLLAFLTRQDLRFRLPPGTVLFLTGGFKGRRRELAREELMELLSARLGIPTETVVGEYGMTELTSQCYTASLSGGDPELFLPPHWMRVRVLDPLSLAELADGQPGLLAFFDLANLGSAAHLLTQDLGVAEREGFRLLGRAAGAELRGCSLAAEELAGG